MSKYDKVIVIPASLENEFKAFMSRKQRGAGHTYGYGDDNKENNDPNKENIDPNKRKRKSKKDDDKKKECSKKPAKKRKPLAEIKQNGKGTKIKGRKKIDSKQLKSVKWMTL